MITAIQYEEKPNDPLMRVADFARHKKVSHQAVSKMVKRHGVKLDQTGRAPLSVWLAADAVGLAMDTNTANARAAGAPEGSLAAQAAKEKVKKLKLESALLEIELAKARSKAIPIEEHNSRIRHVLGMALHYVDYVAMEWASAVRDPAQYKKLEEGIDRAKAAICAECQEAIAKQEAANKENEQVETGH